MLSVINAEYVSEYQIKLQFSDNRSGIANLGDFILNGKLKPFSRLKELHEFRSFSVKYTVIWGEDLDLAPEYLYFKAFENDPSLQTTFRLWGYL